MRRPYIAGNWKMWGTRAEAAAYCERLVSLLPEGARRNADVGICVPFTALDLVAEKMRGSDVRVCAQTMHFEDAGAFTGEISAPMLTELGIDGVVLGHSERRQLFGETDRALQEKVPKALAAGLEPILCVGETEEERESGDTDRKLRHQVQEGLEKVPDEDLARVVIAYEPIWAIGTGRTATPEQAQEACAFIRDVVRMRGATVDAVRILYGGSVKPANAAELMSKPDVDGALVGGASLDPADFAGIVEAAG